MPERKPKPHTAEASRPASGDSPAGEAILCVRLWRVGESADSYAALVQDLHPAVCLLRDLVVAAGATPIDTQGKVFAATCASLADATRTARRLLWAWQGFAQSKHAADLAMAVLVCNREEFPNHLEQGRLPAPLLKAAPGLILLTAAAAKAIEDLAGYALSASEAGCRQLLWRAGEEQCTASADDGDCVFLLQ